jgi:hypothetical protein
MTPLELMKSAPSMNPATIPADLASPECAQWLYTAVMYLLPEVARLKKKVSDLEGRERV